MGGRRHFALFPKQRPRRRVLGGSDGAAYDMIREQAMSKRVTTEEIADAIINANEILSLGKL